MNTCQTTSGGPIVTERAATRVRARVLMSRRRLVPAIVAGLVALVGLAGCRVEPGTAAYVGSTRYTNADVDKLFTEFNERTRTQAAGSVRMFLVQQMVDKDLSRRVAAAHHLSVPAADISQLEQWAQQYGLPAGGGVVHLYADAIAAMNAISSLGTPVAPTDADKREVFAGLVAQQVVTPDQYQQVKDQLDSTEMRSALGLRTVLVDAAKQYHVTVNPKYQPLGISIPFTLAGGNVTAAVSVPLMPNPSPAVVDPSSTLAP